jgi:putative oxidoreductase
VTSLPTSRRREPAAPESRTVARRLRRVDAIGRVGARVSLPLLRISLGIVYIWFGALKLTDSTPVAALVAHTVPFLPEKFFVPALGAFEVLLGLGLLVGRYLGIVALLMVCHLGGTFLVLVTQPELAFRNGNPLMLSMVGEFVVKNVVLITAGILLATASRVREPRLTTMTQVVRAVEAAESQEAVA